MYPETDRGVLNSGSQISQTVKLSFFCQFIFFKFTHGNNYYYLYRADSIGSGAVLANVNVYTVSMFSY